MFLLAAVLSLLQALGAHPPPAAELTPTDTVVVSRKGIEISGRLLRLPLPAPELEGLLGKPDRSEELTNRILIWDRLGIFAYEDPRSGSVHGIAFRYACEELSHCPAHAQESTSSAGSPH